jgi:hypothetical protein
MIKQATNLDLDMESPYLWSGYLAFVPTMWSRSSKNHNQQSLKLHSTHYEILVWDD